MVPMKFHMLPPGVGKSQSVQLMKLSTVFVAVLCPWDEPAFLIHLFSVGCEGNLVSAEP
jgi:hypothetical protein